MFSFFPKPYHHLNKVQISAGALQHNYQVIQSAHPEAQICPVLKSNAYGHGLTTVAPIFDSLGVPFLMVDSLYEAYELRKLKLKTPILILGYTHPDNFKVKRLPFQYAVFDLAVAETLNQFQPGCSVHIFVDTGMSREGISLTDLPAFLGALKKLSHLKVVGLASHLANADYPASQNFTQLQLTHFKTALQLMTEAGFEPQWRHLSASAGSYTLADPVCNMLRVGLASYGLNPLKNTNPALDKFNLKPALRFISTLAQIKTIQAREKVGYNGSFTAPHKMTIGLIPAGYYDGVDRRLSNTGVVKIQGVVCPIIGKVSMNMTTIDLTGVAQPQVGDEVEIYGNDLTTPNSIAQAAATAGTIPYELLVHLAESLKREVVA